MSRLPLLALALLGCNAWVRPEPGPSTLRPPSVQELAAVRVESSCDPFEDGTLGKSRVGSGVMVSDWQVLTAIHVVDCQSAIPTIRVYNAAGQRWKFLPEREWVITVMTGGKRDGVSRIQMASGDHLSPRLGPPEVASEITPSGYPLYLQAAYPERAERIGEATGWAYGGASYGGQVFTYEMTTESGNSGSGIYNMPNQITGIHLGRTSKDLGYAAVVTPEMVPHRQ